MLLQGGPMGRPVAASQSRAVPPGAGEHGLAVGPERHGEHPVLMLQGGPMGRPVAASQSRAVPSMLPVSTALPSGLNAKDMIVF